MKDKMRVKYEFRKILAELVHHSFDERKNALMKYYEIDEREIVMGVVEELDEALSSANVGIGWELMDNGLIILRVVVHERHKKD